MFKDVVSKRSWVGISLKVASVRTSQEGIKGSSGFNGQSLPNLKTESYSLEPASIIQQKDTAKRIE